MRNGWLAPVATALVLTPAAGFLAWWLPYPVVNLFSGRVFQETRIISGGALDQSGLLAGVVLFCLTAAPLTVYVLVVWLCGARRNESALRIWAGLTTVLFVHPFSILFIVLYHLVRYIDAMGPTRMRLLALLFTLISFAAIGLFLRWAWRQSLRLPKTALSTSSR